MTMTAEKWGVFTDKAYIMQILLYFQFLSLYFILKGLFQILYITFILSVVFPIQFFLDFLVLLQSSYRYDSRLWGSRFVPFFNMAARRHHRRTSCYLVRVGMTNLSLVIHMQTFIRQHQYHARLWQMQPHMDVNNNTSHVSSVRIITSEALISLFHITITNGIPVVKHTRILRTYLQWFKCKLSTKTKHQTWRWSVLSKQQHVT